MPCDHGALGLWCGAHRRRGRAAEIRVTRSILPLTFVAGRGSGRVLLGRFEVSQSAVVIAIALRVGVGGGFGAVGFRRLIDLISSLAAHAPLLVSLLIGGALVALLVGRFAPEAKGHGVPEVMAAVALKGGVLHPRVILVKTLASGISIGVGGSCGREGPI